MNRQTLILGLVVVVGCLVLTCLWNQPLAGQAPAAPAGTVGKYQVVVASDQVVNMVILCDTETGRVWQITLKPTHLPAAFWESLGSPVPGP
jgi:hypothetical protein